MKNFKYTEYKENSKTYIRYQISAFCIYCIFSSFSLFPHFLFVEYFKVNLSHFYHFAIISMFNVNMQSSNQMFCVIVYFFYVFYSRKIV